MTQFDVAVSPTGPAVVLRLAGEFDIAAIQEFERAIEVSMDGSAAQLVVGLRGVRFMDSSGLARPGASDRAPGAGAERA